MGLRELVSDNRSLSPLEEPAGMSCPLISRSFWFWGSEGPKVDATQLSARKDLSLFLRRGQLLHGAKTQEDEGSGGKGRRDGKIEGICIGDCDSLPPPPHTGPRGRLGLGSQSHLGRETRRAGASGRITLRHQRREVAAGVEPQYLQSSAEIVRFI